MTDAERIQALIQHAEGVLQVKESVQEFLDRSTPYLEAFDQWQNTVTPGALRTDATLSELLKKLSTLHHQILDHGKSLSTEVLRQLGETHKRAQALRTYIDRAPGRITITGKREG